MNTDKLVWTGVLFFSLTCWAGAFVGAVELSKLIARLFS